MDLVDNTKKEAQKTINITRKSFEVSGKDVVCMQTVLSLITNMVETACEHEPDLDLVRLINYMDLYRVYIQQADNVESEFHAELVSKKAPSDAVLTQTLGNTDLVSFERFVRDTRLLEISAMAASAQSGDKVASPAPLTLSANR